MRARRAARLACCALALACAPGCGLLFLTHDKVLGPISPAGRLHPFVTGTSVRVGRSGPEASAVAGTASFRPYPLEILRHVYRTPVVLLYGVQFYLGFVLRYVLQREEQVGLPLPPEARAALRGGVEGWDVGRVLERLGCPQLWIKRREGSLMVYASRVSRELGISVGVPPGVGALIPIPGVGELLRFDWSSTQVHLDRTLLLFDAEGRLLTVQERAPSEGTEPEDAPRGEDG